MTVTCVIPVKDLSLVSDLDQMFERLNLTIKSINSQHKIIEEIIVVHGPGFDAGRVEGKFTAIYYGGYNFNFLAEKFDSQNDRVRYDKGARVLEGIKSGYAGKYLFVVDWDDIILSGFSKSIENLLADNYSAIYIDSGLVFSDGPLVCKVHSGFSSMCGSTVLLSRDVVEHVRLKRDNHADASVYFGSHVLVKDRIKNLGLRAVCLKSPSVAYRVGYRGNTSGTGGVLRCYFSIFRNPNLKYGLLQKVFAFGRKPDECG